MKMKKKCTNSKCRKTFSLMEEGISRCPYCRKRYKRVVHKKKHPVMRIKNEDYDSKELYLCLRRATLVTKKEFREIEKKRVFVPGEFRSLYSILAQKNGYHSQMRFLMSEMREKANVDIAY